MFPFRVVPPRSFPGMRGVVPLLLASALAAPGAGHVPGSVLVAFREPLRDLVHARALLAAEPGLPAGRLDELLCPRLGIARVELPDTGNEPTLAKAWSGVPCLRWAQLDHLLEPRDTTPDDPLFPSQWNLYNTGSGVDVDAPPAWDLGTGGTDALGSPVVVAIIDSGFEVTHPDLVDNLWHNPGEIAGNGLDDDNNGYTDDVLGWNVYNNSPVLPVHYHGTHVAGIIGARGDNGLQVSGINWQGNLLLVAGSSTQTSLVIQSYNYVMVMKDLWVQSGGTLGANIVVTNSSFGVNFGDCDSGEYPAWNDLYNEMGSMGILSAAATMNLGSDVDAVGDVPTSCTSPWLVAVTNTTAADMRNSAAAWGATSIDLGAPGTQILSTDLNGGTQVRTGTSMASPHVAGAIAWLHSVAPADWVAQYRQQPAEMALALKQLLLDTVDPLPALENLTVSGGRLNLARAGQVLSGGLFTPRVGITVLPGNRLRLSWPAVTGATAYRVETRRDANEAWSVLGQTVETQQELPLHLGQAGFRVVALAPDSRDRP